MAYPYDPNATNLALQNTGSSYRVPTQTQSADMTSGAQPAPQPPPAAAPQPQATDSEVPGQEYKPVETDAGKGITAEDALGGIQSGANAMVSQSDSQKAQGGLNKPGALVGTVLAAYTGNAQGVAGGIQGMSGQAQQERQ